MQARPLPEELAAGPFSTARARELGVAASRLRRGGLSHPTRGAHVHSAPASFAERAAAFTAGMPADRASSHLTAARLLGLPLTSGLAAEADTGALHVIAPTEAGQAGRAGCTALHGRVRPRGKVMLSAALHLVRPRVRSPMETRSRLLFLHAGFPEPETGAVITDEAGEFLAEGDLVWRQQRVVAEYQGAHHANIARRSADSGRRHLLERSGWQVRELFAEDGYRAPRRQAALEAVAAMLGLDPSTLLIT